LVERPVVIVRVCVGSVRQREQRHVWDAQRTRAAVVAATRDRDRPPSRSLVVGMETPGPSDRAMQPRERAAEGDPRIRRYRKQPCMQADSRWQMETSDMLTCMHAAPVARGWTHAAPRRKRTGLFRPKSLHRRKLYIQIGV